MRVHERLDFLLVEVKDELVHVTHVVDDERQSFRRLVELRHNNNNMSTSSTNEQLNRALCFCMVYENVHVHINEKLKRRTFLVLGYFSCGAR